MTLSSFVFRITACRQAMQIALFGIVLALLFSLGTASAEGIHFPANSVSTTTESTLPGLQNTDAKAEDGIRATMGAKESLVVDTALSDASSTQGNSTKPHAEALPGIQTTAAVGIESNPDWDGIWRDTIILTGAQVAAAATLYFMPERVSNWSEEQKHDALKQYNNNFSNPHFDDDKAYVNYVLHPYWGATYYIRARERGLDQASSLMFSALASAIYEFGIECFFEKPSIQDLIVTPVVGSLIGAYLFEPWRESIKQKAELRWYDHAVLIATDPIGVLSLGIEKLLGIKSTIVVDYSTPLQRRSSEAALASRGNGIEVVMTFSF